MVGEQTASSRSDQPRLYGRGDLLAGVVLDQELEIFRDDQPLIPCIYQRLVTQWEGGSTHQGT